MSIPRGLDGCECNADYIGHFSNNPLIFFFAECANVSVPLLMYEDTQACLCQVFEEPLKLLERKVNEADAFLLVTDKTGFEIPPSLATVKHHFTGNNFTWRPYGMQCVLLGGSVHSRKVAMRLRVFLEGSDYPYMAGVLPQRCSWTEMYAVDPSLETPGPCVLWKRQHCCEHLFLDFIEYVDCCISLSLSLLKQTFRSFVVLWAIRLGAFLIRAINNYCLSHCFCSPQTFIKSTIKKMSKCKKRNRIFKVWALYIIFV